MRIKNRTRVLENYIDFIEQDLTIRVESLKFELDRLGEECLEKIDNYEKSSKDRHRKFIQNLETQKTCNLSLNAKISNIEIFTFNDKSKVPSTKLRSVGNRGMNNASGLPTRQMIGFLYGTTSQITLEIGLSNKQLKIEIIDLSCFIKSSCGIAEIYSHDHKHLLALTDFASNDIKLVSKYDSYLLKELDIVAVNKFKINKFKSYYAICTDFDLNSFTTCVGTYGSLYACDMELHRVLIFDLSLTKLKRIISGVYDERSLAVEEFECPRDICYYDGFVYVLDQGKSVVNVFERDGDFVKNFYFNESKTKEFESIRIKNALSVRVNCETIAIIDWKEKCYLFDFNFGLKWIINQTGVMSMCFIGDHLNIVEYPLRIFFHCENGDFVGYKVSTGIGLDLGVSQPVLIYEKNFQMLKCRSEFMIFGSNQKLIISLGWSKSIAIIDF